MTICHAAHLTGDSSIIVKNIHYVIPHLLKRHSRMRSRVHINDYQHSLQILDYDEEYFNPNLFYSVIETNDQSWQHITHKICHQNPYTDNGTIAFPLFHFKLILNKNSPSFNDNLFHLLLFSNHCAADGRSGYILINDFLTLVTSSDLYDRVETVNREIIPSVCQLIPRPYGLLYPIMLFISKCISKRELRKLQHPQIPVKTTFLDSELTSFPLQPVKYHHIFSSTSTTLYSRLREKCQSQQTTLHGPLFACLLLAIHHCFPAEKKTNRYLNSPAIDVDYDLRSRLPGSSLTPSTVGFCIGVSFVELKQRFSLASTPFWILAKKCVSETNRIITNGELHFSQHFFKDIIKNENIFIKYATFFPEGRSSEVNFSNIGKYPFSCDYNQIRLRGLHVNNNAPIYRPSVGLLITCAGNDQLDISLSHEIETEQKAQDFVDYYISLVKKCADADIKITLQELLTSVE